MNKYELNAKGMACPLPVVKTKKLLEDYDVVEVIVDNVIATQNLEKLAKQLEYFINITTIKEKIEYKVVISKIKMQEIKVINTLCDTCVIPVTQAKRVLEEENRVQLLIKDEVNVEKLKDFANQNGYKFLKNNEEDYFKITIEKPIAEDNNKIIEKKDEDYIVVVNKKIMGHGSEELGKRLIKAYFYALTEQEVLPKKMIFYNDGGELVDKNRSHVLAELKELESRGVDIVCCGACIDYHKIDLAVGNPTNMYFIVEDMRKANKIIRP